MLGRPELPDATAFTSYHLVPLKTPHFPPGFAAYAVAAAVAVVPALLLPVASLREGARRGRGGAAVAAATPSSPPPSLTTRLTLLLANPRAITFFGCALCLGFACSVSASFLPVYLTDLGAPPTLLGAAIAVACVTELPVFYWSGALVRRFGARRVLDVSAAAVAARLAGYTVAGSSAAGAWAVVPLEALHGLAFAGSWSTGTDYAARLAPPGLRSTAQSLFSAAYMGVGAGTGALVGGALYSHSGPDACFQGSAAALVVAWALLCVAEAAISEGDEVEGSKRRRGRGGGALLAAVATDDE
jgi:MFS family permease